MSGFIPERILDEIRFRNDIVELISAYVPLKRTGATYKACCPFHKERTPSFNVNPNLQIFKCFGCGEGGDVITFLMKHQGMDFITAARVLAERVGIEIDVQEDGGEAGQRKVLYAIHHGIAQFYRRCLEQYAGAQAARDYIAQRGLGGEAAETFQIGYAPLGGGNAITWGAKHGYSPDILEKAGLVLRSDQPSRRGEFYDRFRDRLMFPIHDAQGRIVAFSARLLVKDPKRPKYVNSPESPIFSKGRVLYGLDKARKHIVNAPSREALVCEGQIDVIRCHLGGFPTAVAAQGTAFTDSHVQLLKTYADSAVLIFDGDPAGQAATVKTAHLLMRSGMLVRVAELPAGEDPDSFLQTQGSAVFRERLQQADSLVAYQIRVLTRGEADARGIAATARLATAVLESISCCSNAVLRERMLQEAAQLLDVPQRALETDLAALEAARKAQSERYSRGGESPRPVRVAEHVGGAPEDMPPPMTDPVGDAPFGDEPLDEDMVPTEVLDILRQADSSHEVIAPGLPPPPRARQSPVSVAPRPAAMPPDERALCEVLVQGEQDRHLAMLVEEHLPLQMLQDKTCRHLVEAALATAGQPGGLAVLLEGREDPVQALWSALKQQPVKIRGGDYTYQDAIKDVILGFWRRYLLLEKKKLELPSADKKAQAAARRAQITMDLNALKQWSTGQDVMMIERAMLEEREAAAGV